jgi:hypothetical protein
MAAYLVETSKGKRLIEARTQASAINFVMQSEVTAKNLSTTELIKHIKDGMTVETVNPEDVKPVLEHIEESQRTDAANEKPADEDSVEAEGDGSPEVKRGFGGRFTSRKSA